jgi:hypothetical protein
LGWIEESFVRRVAPLAGDTRLLLLVAAAEPVGDPLLLWEAAQRLGIAPKAATDAAALLTIGDVVIFRHPLVRSAVYTSSSAEDRRAVHLALAEVTDREIDPDRRAWHLAAAAAGPDEEVAVELERSAGRAQARGGVAAAAAFLKRAVALTLDPERRANVRLARRKRIFRPARLMRLSSCWPARGWRLWMLWGMPGSSCCVAGSRSPQATAARLWRCS